uniref:Uncharacterized protein n=1 Tax=Avena sativa TaxID=4498 RepID=A0ACD5ZYY2_AVESA
MLWIATTYAQSGGGSETSPETSWQAEVESLLSILCGVPHSKLGRVALVDSLSKQIRTRIRVRLPNLLNGLQGKPQIIQEELAKLGEQMVETSEGTRVIALGLCREFEDTFLQHIAGGEVVLEADGYQPYLISPESGLKSLIKGLLELAKEPSTLLVDEVHRVLLDIVSAAANATPGLGRYPPFKREVIAIASAALEGFKNEAKKMVVALVDMERAFVPPQHFIRLVQKRMERQRHEDEFRNRAMKKGSDADQYRAASPQAQGKEESNLQILGPAGEIIAGFLFKRSAKGNDWSRRWFVLNEKSGKLGYTKKQEERHFRGVINLEECNLEEVLDEEDPPSSSKDSKRSSGTELGKASSLVFKITNNVAYKHVLKAHSDVVLKAESMADRTEWVTRIKSIVAKRTNVSEGGSLMRQSHSDGSLVSVSKKDGSLDTMLRKHVDPEVELQWISQEVRGYVEAVLSSLATNVPKLSISILLKFSDFHFASSDVLLTMFNRLSFFAKLRRQRKTCLIISILP